MTALPINLHVADRLVVVVGGGPLAARRAAMLLSAGARVRMVAPDFCSEALAIDRADLARVERRYENADLVGAFLVLAATNERDVNAQVCADTRSAGVLCSNASDPRSGDFTFPAAGHYGGITIAVDTGGASPELAKKLLDKLSAELDKDAGAAADTLRIMREHLFAVGPAAQRSHLLREFANLPLEMLAALSADDARKYVENAATGPEDKRRSETSQVLTCASRGSRLALVQTFSITSALERAGLESRVLTIATHGDLAPQRPLSAMNAENIFVKEIETALLERRADYAVHSCKD